MSVHYPMISIFLYTHFYIYNTKLELCSMATSGRVIAAFSMVSLSEAFTGVHGGYNRVQNGGSDCFCCLRDSWFLAVYYI